MVENASGAITKDVPLAGQATASPAKGEKNTNLATTNAEPNLHDELMLKRRKSSKITNYDVLTQKGPISLKVHREDGTSEVIEKFKASDLQLAEWREVVQACPDRKEKGWKTIYELIKTRMEYLEQTEKELHIDFNKSLQEQDPLDELNDLANKKRKRTGDSTDHSSNVMKVGMNGYQFMLFNLYQLFTQAEVVQFEMLKFLQHQLFRSLEDWEVSSLQCMQRRFTRREKDCFMPKGIKQFPLEKMLLKSAEKYIRFSSKDCTWLKFKFEGDNTPIAIQPPCYSASKDLGKLKPKATIGIFIGYSPFKKDYQIYNKRPEFQPLTSGHISLGLMPNQTTSTSAKPPLKNDLDLLFQPMFNEYFKPSPSDVSIIISVATLPPPYTAGDSSSTTIDQDAPSLSTSPTIETTTTPIQSTNVEEPNNENKDAEFDSDTFTNLFAPPVTSSVGSSSRIADTSNMHTFQQPHSYIRRWTKDHPLVTIISNPSKHVSTRRQLTTNAMWCYFHAFLTKVELKNYKEAMKESSWIEAMQEEIHEFERLKVWELVPKPSKVMIVNLKWIFKVKVDKYGGV
ncbi:retrovirus-related pol polyprotein from transposon TNT 1-94 [Tanacetum coccineum]